MTLEEIFTNSKALGLTVRDYILYQSLIGQTSGSLVLGAGENHIGQVGGNTTITESNVLMSVAGSYSTGDYMGTSLTPQYFPSAVRTTGGTGIIKSITIIDKITNTNVAMELWIFSETFTAPNDNNAFTVTDSDALKVQAIIPISTSEWYANGSNQIYHDSTISIPIKVAGGENGRLLHYALVARGATPSFTSLDLTIKLGILQD